MSDLSRDLSAVKCHKDALVNIFNLSCFTYFIVSITESLGGGGGGGQLGGGQFGHSRI